MNNQVEQLVEAVLNSPKYKHICRDLVANIGRQELAKRGKLKEAVKATKNKLHQVGGAYLTGKMNYAAWLDELREAGHTKARDNAENQDDFENQKFLDVCAKILSYHSSTKERLPILDQFYTTLLAGLPPIRTAIDLACGLNPLAFPWMPLAAEVEYYAYDIYQDMVDFINEFMTIARVDGRAEVCDVVRACPTRQADLAFILKAIPCLEQLDKSAGVRLLDAINADHLLISFPGQTLGGREKGMVATYEARFEELMAGRAWSIKRFEFMSELVFLVIR